MLTSWMLPARYEYWLWNPVKSLPFCEPKVAMAIESWSLFEQLQKACDDHSLPVAALRFGPALQTLRADPRYPTLLKRIRDTGVLVGLSAHDPGLIELAEAKGWDIDYYMCCLYYLTRPKAEFEKLLGGEVPIGEIYLQSDPPKMFKVIRSTSKPCLAYKVLAAGRKIENPAQIRQSFETAFSNIKPTDAVIVGMYQQLSDQVHDNATLVRTICATKS